MAKIIRRRKFDPVRQRTRRSRHRRRQPSAAGNVRPDGRRDSHNTATAPPRLLEEEGIFYFFEHSSDSHTMVLADSPTEIKPSPFHPKLDSAGVVENEEIEAVVSRWETLRRIRPSRFELRDFNFRNPTLDLATSIWSRDDVRHEREVYDYPGEYESRESGEKLVRVRYEEEKSKELNILATTNGRGFSAGFRFRLENHPRKEMNGKYAVLEVVHRGDQSGTLRSDDSGSFDYSCQLSCIPHPVNFRPTRKTPIPKVQGTQTAIVVGPAGEEIYVDKHGRVLDRQHFAGHLEVHDVARVVLHDEQHALARVGSGGGRAPDRVNRVHSFEGRSTSPPLRAGGR